MHIFYLFLAIVKFNFASFLPYVHGPTKNIEWTFVFAFLLAKGCVYYIVLWITMGSIFPLQSTVSFNDWQIYCIAAERTVCVCAMRVVNLCAKQMKQREPTRSRFSKCVCVPTKANFIKINHCILTVIPACNIKSTFYSTKFN